MTNKRVENFLQIQQAWLTIDQRHHIDAENSLQLSLLIQIVEHDIARLTASQLYDHAHAILV